MKYVNQPVRKTDAMSLVTGKPVYTDDLAPKDCLIVKALRSPHANAWVEDIKTGNALPLVNIPVGTFVHNVELYPGRGGQLARAAGSSFPIT